jgi:hypothetical protein
MLAITLTSGAAPRRNWGFLWEAPVADFNSADFDLMLAAASEVLNGSERGATKCLQNAATGNRGNLGAELQPAPG